MSALKQFDPGTDSGARGLVLGDLALYSIAEVEALEKRTEGDTAQAPLLIHFLEMLSEKLAAAGCNDMDMQAFDEVHDMPKLRAMFDAWNPEYIGEPLEHIPDFLWVEFLTDQLRAAIDAARKEAR